MFALVTKDRLRSEVEDSDTYIRLPMGREVTSRDGWTAEPPIGPPRELLRVLIVDDYRASADTMSMLVGAWGHDVRRAYDGTTGLALAAAYQPDVLLLDIVMPGISGLELTRQVRRQARLNDCLVIAVTGRTDAGHRLQCEEAGIDLFLIKPVDLSYLETLLTVESDYRLRSRREATTRNALSTKTLQKLTGPNFPRPTQLPCRVMQATVAS